MPEWGGMGSWMVEGCAFRVYSENEIMKAAFSFDWEKKKIMSFYMSIVEELERASQVMRLVKESACQYMRHKRCEFSPWVGKILWRRAGQSTSVFLPGKSHG